MSYKLKKEDTLNIKISVVGLPKVGKTSLIQKYCKYYGEDKNIYKKIMVFKNRKLQLLIYDIELKYESYYLYCNSTMFIYVFDVTDNNDFEKNLRNRYKELRRYGPFKGKVPRIICGTKADLPCVVDENIIDKFICEKKEHSNVYIEKFKVSINDNVAIDNLFEAVLPYAIETQIEVLKDQNKYVPPPIKKECVLV
ncbi:hypothetical protein EIN_358590 [Entamoeba invadens IP1]|uniref:Uncharacterized protein n=1 Tax=Entamoeba invadens IP1 TaxID=370355 RepID=A0A0A1TW97_ENTIV|nr:hypothetical protein EIN_358590 [Entamoeba invadens IP1]ELP84939.1 hypothetical protein EIN_358590 [Entamoeba invadens IP1]|eukprot:XP_004184285.1 hypothetical protein EIN_358590 [Entamoeba invadens IP1]